MRRLLLFVFLLTPALAAAVDTPTYQKTITYQLHFRLNSRWVNGDSADVVSAYPSSEDTTGKRLELTWIGGDYNEWDFVPDSTDAYDFYARSSASLSDTLLPEVSGRLWWANDVPEGLISDSRAFSSGVLSAALLADGGFSARSDDSTAVVDTDYVKAIYLWARSALSVQQGDTTTTADDIFYVNDAVFRVQAVPAEFDSAVVGLGLLVQGEAYLDTVRTPGVHTAFPDSTTFSGNMGISGDMHITGDVNATIINASSTINSTSVLGTSQFDGSLQIGNDLVVDDDATVTGGLTASTTADVQDSLQAGSTFGSMGFSADSLAAAAVLGGWLVLDEVHIGAATITSGNTTVTYNMPGARPWDTFVIPAFNGNATSVVGTNALFVWDVPSEGKITFTRIGTSGDLQIKFLVVKYR